MFAGLLFIDRSNQYRFLKNLFAFVSHFNHPKGRRDATATQLKDTIIRIINSDSQTRIGMFSLLQQDENIAVIPKLLWRVDSMFLLTVISRFIIQFLQPSLDSSRGTAPRDLATRRPRFGARSLLQLWSLAHQWHPARAWYPVMARYPGRA
jgi:hypothetical protein